MWGGTAQEVFPSGMVTPDFDQCDGGNMPLEDKLKHKLKELGLYDPHQAPISNDDLLKLKEVWKGHMDNDEKYFNYHVQHSNCLAFILIKRKKPIRDIALATDLTEQALEQDKNNCFALLNKYYLDAEEEVLKQLLKVLESTAGKENIIRFRAEMAHLFLVLGNKYYALCVQNLEKVVQWLLLPNQIADVPADVPPKELSDKLYAKWESKTSAEERQLRKDFVYWVFQLAQAYSQLLTKPNLPILSQKIKRDEGFNRTTCYEMSYACFDFVIRTKDAFLCGWAYAEIALVYELYTTGVDTPKTFVIGTLTVDDCFKQAIELAPKHPGVLFIVGRYYRTRANTFQDFKKAIPYFEKAIEMNEFCHKAHHHLGLANRELWLISGRYKEAKTKPTSKKKKVPTATLR